MEVLYYCKLQICILFILFFASYLFVKDGNRLNKKSKEVNCNPFFDKLFIYGEASVFFDGVTAFTVNYTDTIPNIVNLLLHLCHFLLYQYFVFTFFRYWLSVTGSMPKNIYKKLLYYVPIAISMLITVITVTHVEYNVGKFSNYPSGVPLYATFLSLVYYGIMSIGLFYKKRSYIQKNRFIAFVMAFIALVTVLFTQIIWHETLAASIAVCLIVLSIYLCLENPTIKFLEFYHNEMIMGFTTLVESKDGSTGGHIRRSSAYAVLIASELRNNPKYKNYITKDYILNMKKAAPMHDIGKIGVPDSILQKPGKLTDEEFTAMKKHSEIGGKIILETFGHLDDEDYEDMTFKTALSHHEKWNGKGYPNHLSGTNIPLCARIMSVADVFDAVSAKRCYRDALPLEVCYKIIRDGRGIDFDPDIVDAFFACQSQVESIYHSA